MHQKEEYALPVTVAIQRNLSKKASSAANTKNNEWRCPIINLLASTKIISLKTEDSLCVFKNGLTFSFFVVFFEQDALILNDWVSFVTKNKIDNCQLCYWHCNNTI